MKVSDELFFSTSKGCQICSQTFGEASDPAIIIISGYGMPIRDMPWDFVPLLSPPDHPHFVVRFDHRDTGRSTSFTKPSDGSPVYTLDDMADVFGLINHLKLERVHFIGMSMGGPISWLITGRLPGIVDSLALVVTGLVGSRTNPSDGLPPLKPTGNYFLNDALELPDSLEDDAEGAEFW